MSISLFVIIFRETNEHVRYPVHAAAAVSSGRGTTIYDRVMFNVVFVSSASRHVSLFVYVSVCLHLLFRDVFSWMFGSGFFGVLLIASGSGCCTCVSL